MESSTLHSVCCTKIQKRRIILCVSFLLLQIKCRNHLKTTRICCLIVSEGLVWAQLSWILAQGLRGPRSRHGPCSGSPLKLGVIFQAHSVLLLNSAPCRIEVPVFLLSVSWGLCSAPGGHLFPVTQSQQAVHSHFPPDQVRPTQDNLPIDQSTRDLNYI